MNIAFISFAIIFAILAQPSSALFRRKQPKKQLSQQEYDARLDELQRAEQFAKKDKGDTYAAGITMSALTFGALAPFAAVSAGKAKINHMKTQRRLRKFERTHTVKQA